MPNNIKAVISVGGVRVMSIFQAMFYMWDKENKLTYIFRRNKDVRRHSSSASLKKQKEKIYKKK